MLAHFYPFPQWRSQTPGSCNRSSRQQQSNRCFPQPTQQLKEIDLADLLESILATGTIAYFLVEPEPKSKPTKLAENNCDRKSTTVSAATKNNKFEVKVDVRNFAAEEIDVKVVENSTIIVEAKHEEKVDNDGGFISRQFVRRIPIPERVIVEQLKCTMSEDCSTLNIFGPFRTPIKEPVTSDRQIPIQFAGINSEEMSPSAPPASEPALPSVPAPEPEPVPVAPAPVPTTSNTEESPSESFEFINI